jgi:hypothetical protein
MRATSIIAFIGFLGIPLLVAVVDPGMGSASAATFTDIAHALAATLSAHPFEAALGVTAFPINPLDRVMTLKEWRRLRRISASTERRLRAAGLGPKITRLTRHLIGIRVRDDLEWIEAGGASAQSEDPPAVKRRTRRNIEPATAA